MANQPQKRKISFSGIQASGDIHLGNYLGAIKNWVALQEQYSGVYSIVDMHAITVRQDPKSLRDNTLRAYALMIACGIDLNKSIFFIQSHVPAHAELAWALGCYTPFGELGRMTQFKDKSAKGEDNINAGLFTYPILMASDILLYDADVVPVGEDQKQHLELSRNIALRVNGIYGNVFKVPEAFIPKVGGRIMSLADPTKKMAKSDDNPKAAIALLDTKDVIMKKFKSAVTDSEAEIVYREGKDGINNLLTIYSIVTGKDIPAAEKEFSGMGYGVFKPAVGEAVADFLAPIQKRFDELYGDKAQLEQIYRENAQKAAEESGKTLRRVYDKIGFVPR
ncbi:MAG: tryptophan--tRNA ligase [Oscillospiraceae bacterium]|nr:tryptophan--tRNA ligase [Oscillospiraceae bacterium]